MSDAVTLLPIGRGADDLRFFIRLDGRHAGGITVHSVRPPSFSYGIAVAPALRGRGVARRALKLLFEEMARRGFSFAVVQVAPDNAASLALHDALGFSLVAQDAGSVTLARAVRSTPGVAAAHVSHVTPRPIKEGTHHG